MLHSVKDRIQQEMARAGTHEIAELVDAFRAAPPDGDARSHIGKPVTRAEPVTEAALCARTVIINGHIYPLRDCERTWIALLFFQEAP